MPGLSDALSVFERLEGRHLGIEEYRCVLVRNRNATCARCAEACTSGCISYEDNELKVASDKCTGCGTCATACPTGAIAARRPDDEGLFRSCLAACASAHGESVIADARMLDAATGLVETEKVARVADLGRVDESLVVGLVLAGASSVTLVHGPRDDGERDVGIATAKAVCESANELLAAWNSPVRARVAERLPKSMRKGTPDEFDAARRGFFASLGSEARDVAATTAEYALEKTNSENPPVPKYPKVGTDGTLPHFLPERRKRLLGALRHMGEPCDGLVTTRLWGNVVVDAQACSGCRMCATFCPTGALAVRENDGAAILEHAPAACVKCRACKDICPERAITISDEVFALDLFNASRERIPIPPEPPTRSNPHSIETAMRSLLGTPQVFER